MAEIEGDVEPGYEAVADAFERLFGEHGEVGATACAYLDGRPVVDLAGGAVPGSGPYRRGTLQLVFSTTKGVATICVLLLADRGQLDLDAPVATYWPEFAASGKSTIPLRVLLSHRAGLPGLADPEGLSPQVLLAVAPFVELLAAEAPWWPPGSAFGYHALTFGYLAGEVVRRVTGRTIGAVLATEVAAPLALDCYIGLPDDPTITSRVASSLFAAPEPGAYDALLAPPRPDDTNQVKAGRMLLRLVGYDDPASGIASDEVYNSEAMRATENPSANGITNASSLAKLYAATLGEVDGIRLLSAAAIEAATEPQTDGLDDLMFGADFGMRFGVGCALPSERSPLLGAGSFGHRGAGGSLALAKLRLGCSFAYVPNRMAPGRSEDPRGSLLLDAFARCLDEAG